MARLNADRAGKIIKKIKNSSGCSDTSSAELESKPVKNIGSRGKVNENIQKNIEQLDSVRKDDIDSVELNSLINEAISIIRKTFRNSAIPAKEKRDKALTIVNKYLPSGLNIKHDATDSFISVVKDLHNMEKNAKRSEELKSKKKK